MASHLFPTYARYDLAFERGEGVWLLAVDGERYLDLASGVAVNALGHAHPHAVAALTAQAQKLWHVSNYYRIPEGERLADRLCQATFAERVFFCNSGAEAAECAIKTARKYFAAGGQPERVRIVTFEGAFHGRTLATLAAGGQKKYLEGFGPVVEGFDQVPFGDIEAVKRVIGETTAAIMVEPVQGEGGLRMPPAGFLKALRKLCDDRDLLLVFDEIQTGVGRTGELFAYQRAGVTPDIMAIAKAIGGGFPLGACLATEAAARGMVAGSHGSTFGGNPLAMAVGNAVLDVVQAPGFLDRVRKAGLVFTQRLAELKDRFPGVIAEVRGEGLMLGLRVVPPNTQVIDALRMERLLAIPAGDNVVRLFAPLIITDAEIAEAGERIARACLHIARTAQNSAQQSATRGSAG